MRSMPSIASTAVRSSENRRFCGRSRVPYELTFWPSSVTSRTPSAASSSISATSSSSGRLTSRPRVDGTMQNEQRMLQPAEICTQPWNSRVRLAGRWPVNPSNSKKPWAVRLSLVRNSASLWTWPGPNATSTNGNCANTRSFIDCAQQPPTPITRSGFLRLSTRASYRCATKRSSAFSRIEQVLKRIRSASWRSATSAYPSDSSMPFMCSESCSFIWHPNVVTWKDFTALTSVVGCPRLPDHGDLDLPRVLDILLDLASDLVAEQDGVVVVERAGHDHHAVLAPELNRIDSVTALVAC